MTAQSENRDSRSLGDFRQESSNNLATMYRDIHGGNLRGGSGTLVGASGGDNAVPPANASPSLPQAAAPRGPAPSGLLRKATSTSILVTRNNHRSSVNCREAAMLTNNPKLFRELQKELRNGGNVTQAAVRQKLAGEVKRQVQIEAGRRDARRGNIVRLVADDNLLTSSDVEFGSNMGRLKAALSSIKFGRNQSKAIAESADETKKSLKSIRMGVMGFKQRMFGEESDGNTISASSSVSDGSKDIMGSEQTYIRLPSRYKHEDALRNAVIQATTGKPQIVVIHGNKFLGKSRAIKEVSSIASQKMGFRILTSFSTSLDSFTSYFCFRKILSRALEECVKTAPKDPRAKLRRDSVSSAGSRRSWCRRSSDASCASLTSDADDELFTSEEDHTVAHAEYLYENKFLDMTDQLMLGYILPDLFDERLISLLHGQNPNTLTKGICKTLLKILKPIQPVMLMFDSDGEGDMDSPSWNLLSELMQASIAEGLRLFVTVASRKMPTVPYAIMDLVYEVKLLPLEKDDTEMYVRALLGLPSNGDNLGVDKDVIDVVYERAEGCPLFTERVVSYAQDNNIFVFDESRNTVALDVGGDIDGNNTAADRLPLDIVDIVLEALNGLPPELWDVLKIASCIGYSFDINIYEALESGLGFQSRLAHLEEMFEIFERLGDGRYQWKHRAVYEAVRSVIITNERVEIHAMISEEIEKAENESRKQDGKGLNDSVLRARHCVLADKFDSALQMYMSAGKRAEERFNFSEAEVMYRQAIDCIKRAGSDVVAGLLSSPKASLARIRRGSCLRELGQYDEAEEEIEKCKIETEKIRKDNSGDVGDDDVYLEALAALATLRQAQSKYSEARMLYEEALPTARAEQGRHSALWVAGHIARYAEILRKSGEFALAEEHHREALDLRLSTVGQEEFSELEFSVSHTQLGCTMFAQGKVKEALEHHQKALSQRFNNLEFSHALVSESLNYCAEALNDTICWLTHCQRGLYSSSYVDTLQCPFSALNEHSWSNFSFHE